MVALPLHSTRTQTILEAFQKGYMAYFGPPSHIVCDQDSAFISTLMEAFTEKLGINMIIVSVTCCVVTIAQYQSQMSLT